MLIDIWCRVFMGNRKDRKELLECIRPLIRLSGEDDQKIFNYWADKEGVEKMGQKQTNYIRDS